MAKPGPVNTDLKSVSELPKSSTQMSDLLLLGLIILLLGAESLFYPFGRDQGIHATIAFGLDHGLLPYLDIYNVKPPLTTFFHWLSQALFGHKVSSIRILDLLLVLLTAGMLYRLTLLLMRSRLAAVTAGVFFGLFYFGENFWETAQTDGWTSVFVVAAMLLLVTASAASGRSRRFSMFLAGLLVGFAVLLKYTIILVSLPMLAWVMADTSSRPNIVGNLVFLILGGITAFIGIVGLMLMTETLLPFLDIQLYILEYAVGSGLSFEQTISIPLLRIASHAPVASVLSLLGFVLVLWNLFVTRRNVAVSLLLLLWVLTGFASGILQGKGFPYHYLPLHPPLALLAAATVAYLCKVSVTDLGLHRARITVVVTLILAVFLSWVPAATSRVAVISTNGESRAQYYYSRFESPDYSWRDNLLVTNYLAANLSNDETLFVWGYETGVYFLANKVPVSRFIFPWPLIVDYADGRYLPELLDGLYASMPDVFLVQSGDATPHVTGHGRDSAQSLAEISELNRFLAENYAYEKNVGRFFVFRKTAGSAVN
jgi:hypothetical protein